MVILEWSCVVLGVSDNRYTVFCNFSVCMRCGKYLYNPLLYLQQGSLEKDIAIVFVIQQNESFDLMISMSHMT